MAFNSFGCIYKFTTWGESHGSVIGCTVDGVPSCLHITEEYIQGYVDKRSPGASLGFSSARKEEDKVEILSGIFENRTTGAPVTVIVKNQDQKPSDYNELKKLYRPGHADLLYHLKYSNYDFRGGGRSSGRETVSRVIAGSIARKIISSDIKIQGTLISIGTKVFEGEPNYEFAQSHPLFFPMETISNEWISYLKDIKKSNDSVGAMCSVKVTGLPLGLGEPIYKKLNAYIAEAIMGINAVKSIEIGVGSKCAYMKGSEYIDPLDNTGKKYPMYQSNKSGGIIGGISNGMPLIIKFAVKPTSSINIPIHTVDTNFQNTKIQVKGRHDICIGLRVIPVAEAMIACVLADLTLMAKIRNFDNISC